MVAETRKFLAVRDRMGVKIGEAFMVRTHPQWLRARELVASGRIGQLRSALGFFSYFNNDPSNIRNIPVYGGGALMDIGCYLSPRRGSCSAKSLHACWDWWRETRT